MVGLSAVIEALSEMLSGRTVVSKEELERKAIRSALKVLGLKMSGFTEEDLKEVVLSLIETPISIRSAHFPEKILIDGVQFYHLHTKRPDIRELEIAYAEYIKSKSFLERLGNTMLSADKFFESYRQEGYFLRFYEADNRYAVFFSTITDLDEDSGLHLQLASEFDGEYVVIVQTEEKPDEFVKFFKLHSEEFKRGNTKVWVANPEKWTIDPFIGYPRDLKLLKRFKNPKTASQIESLWRGKVEEID
ncbi:MAG: hypothetical protein HA489_04755 [Archaeoglobales archaeon]|nr:hypothetical protein [Archaeoglobales archaeon]